MGIMKHTSEENNNSNLKKPTFSKQIKSDNGVEPTGRTGFSSGVLYPSSSSLFKAFD